MLTLAPFHLCDLHSICYKIDISMNYIFAFAFGIGFTAGLRSLTPPAVVAWAAHLGWLNLSNSAFAFMGSTITVVIFSLLAVLELISDLLPQTSKRTAPVPLMARIIMGALCGACLCAASNQSLIIGAILGAFLLYLVAKVVKFGLCIAGEIDLLGAVEDRNEVAFFDLGSIRN